MGLYERRLETFLFGWSVSPLFFYGCIRLITLIYGSKRCCILPCTSKYDRFTARISLETTGVLRPIRTAIYGRNTVPTKRVSHSPYTVVIIMYTDVFVRVNDRKPSFAIVVTLDLGVIFSSFVNYISLKPKSKLLKF
jgi:hypothetical protein